MVSIDLTKEEIKQIILLMESSQVPIAQAEPAVELFKKLKASIK